LPPQELVDKWLTVLRAAQRHVQQLPATRLGERAVHSRDRSIRGRGEVARFYITNASNSRTWNLSFSGAQFVPNIGWRLKF
jgi:hypothetical protein